MHAMNRECVLSVLDSLCGVDARDLYYIAQWTVLCRLL